MHELKRLKKNKYALKICTSFFFNANIFINKDILLNILVHNNSKNFINILY
jgi:hypothetical protein